MVGISLSPSIQLFQWHRIHCRHMEMCHNHVDTYKKGQESNPECYRPISLLSSLGKWYSYGILPWLKEWLEAKNIKGQQQIGFRVNCPTIDHCLLLYHLAEKYKTIVGGYLDMAFMNLKGAFDSINHDKLWQRLGTSTIYKHLLGIIQDYITGQVHCGLNVGKWQVLLT